MNTPPDDKLNAALAKLPRDIPPARDLWPGIATHIAARRTHSRRTGWSYGAAAAAVVVVAVAAVWTTRMVRTPESGNPVIAITVPVTSSTPPETVDPRAQFAAQLASDTGLPPVARRALLSNLQLVQENILRTQAAVKKYPGDVNLRALLFNLYQQEARLMNEAQQAQIQTTVRTAI